MSIAFLCCASEPAVDSSAAFEQAASVVLERPAASGEIDSKTRAMLLQMQAEFNRNGRRGAKRESSYRDREDSGSSDDEDSGENVCEAVDAITGQVLFNHRWMPYVCLRWADRTLPDKVWLDTEVKSLQTKPIDPRHDALDRTPVNEVHPIVPLHVIPKLDDGTPEGGHERLIYRLKGKKFIGISTLELVRKGFKPGSDERNAFERFVSAEFKKIIKAGKDQTRLARLMGLSVEHHDFMPRMDGYKFKHFNFGLKRSETRVDVNLELEMVQVLANMRQETIAAQRSDQTEPGDQALVSGLVDGALGKRRRLGGGDV